MINTILNSILSISPSVSGVTEWSVWIRVDTGSGYGDFTDTGIIYECENYPDGEDQIYVFNYQMLINSDDFSVGNIFQIRFIPTGDDLGNTTTLGESFIDSEEYQVLLSFIAVPSQMSLSPFRFGF